MREVEAKILEINVDEVRNKLISLGAKKGYQEKITTKFLDFEDQRLFNNHQTLRIRKIGDKVELTLKGPREKDSEFKVREEIETNVKDFDTILKIFEKIGIVAKKGYEKQRESYKLGNLSFEMDTFTNLNIPTYLEIESEDEKEIEEIVEKLGFKKSDLVSFGLSELLDHYNININELR